MNIETASLMLDALGHPKRLRIFHVIARFGSEGCSVGALADEIQIPAATLSHHLSRLAKTGLVTQKRRGTTLLCRVEPAALMSLSAYLLQPGEQLPEPASS